jgi:Fe-S-cluster formation regulator IscX/YfhJ
MTIRPYSGPKSFTWELDSIEPEVGPTQSKFVDVATVVVQLQQQYDLDLSPPPPA